MLIEIHPRVYTVKMLYINFSCFHIFQILTPFLLRRLKTDVDLTIPPKKEVYVYAPLTEKQQTFYKSTLDRTIMDMLEKNKVYEWRAKILIWHFLSWISFIFTHPEFEFS